MFKEKIIVAGILCLFVAGSCKEKIKKNPFYGTWIEIRKETDSGIVFLRNGKTLIPGKIIKVKEYDTLIVEDFRTNSRRRRTGTIYDSLTHEFYLDSIYKYTTNFKDTLRLTKHDNLHNVNITSIFLKVDDNTIAAFKKRGVYYTRSDSEYVRKVIMNTNSSPNPATANTNVPILGPQVMPVLKSKDPRYKVNYYGSDVYPVYAIEKNTKKEKDSIGYWVNINAKGKVNYVDYLLAYTTEKYSKDLKYILNNKITFIPGNLLGNTLIGRLFIVYKYDK